MRVDEREVLFLIGLRLRSQIELPLADSQISLTDRDPLSKSFYNL